VAGLGLGQILLVVLLEAKVVAQPFEIVPQLIN